jgi:hypothetical protein
MYAPQLLVSPIIKAGLESFYEKALSKLTIGMKLLAEYPP